MKPLIYDTEIKKAILADGEAPQSGIQYCQGWKDFGGMGIACITAYDVAEARPRIFMEDNLPDFDALAQERTLVGWNNHKFDDRLLEANGIEITPGMSIDIASHCWRAAGFAEGERPTGFSLAATLKANGLQGKSGNGAMAPILYQTGRTGELIDYCMTDTLRTLQLYRYIKQAGGLRDPRNGNWLTVVLPW